MIDVVKVPSIIVPSVNVGNNGSVSRSKTLTVNLDMEHGTDSNGIQQVSEGRLAFEQLFPTAVNMDYELARSHGVIPDQKYGGYDVVISLVDNTGSLIPSMLNIVADAPRDDADESGRYLTLRISNLNVPNEVKGMPLAKGWCGKTTAMIEEGI